MNDSTTGYAGVDWATDAHAVCVVDGEGRVVAEFDVAHTAEGLGELCGRVQHAGVARVAIERPDGPVVDALLAAGLEVVVVASRSVKALRERYGTSGNKSDRSDAYVLADCLRTDGHRWRSLVPDSPATVTLRTHVRARKDLVETRVAVANQLRAHLRTVFPGAVGLFRHIDSPISLRFLERFPSATRAGCRRSVWVRGFGPTGTAAARPRASCRPTSSPRPPAWWATTATPGGPSPSPMSPCSRPCDPRSKSSTLDSLNSSMHTPTRRSSDPCHAAPRCGRRPCSPRSETVAPGSQIPSLWPASPVSLHRRARAAGTERSPSASAATRNSAMRCVTSPATAGGAMPGPRLATEGSVRQARPTPMPNGFSPAAGLTSSGAAGRTARPMTPVVMVPINAS
jgi:hypothetical protein